MNLAIFGLNGSKNYAAKVARQLDVKLQSNTEQHFEDGETYVKSNVNVRNADVYVIAGLYSDKKQSVNEKLVDLMWFCGSLKDASAGRVTVVAPYLGYQRQDRKTESRAPIATQYLAKVMKGIGIDRILTIETHSLVAFQNAFGMADIRNDNLDTIRLFTDYLVGQDSDGTPVEEHIENPLCENPDNIAVLSPDLGGINRTGVLQTALEKRLKAIFKRDIPISFAVYDKRRIAVSTPDDAIRTTKASGSGILGDVKGKRVILYDDMIGTGGTIGNAVAALESDGGEQYAVCCAHGLFTGEAEKRLAPTKKIVIADTIPPFRLDQNNWGNGRLKIVSTTRLVAQAIKRTHEEGGSLSDLLTV